ncbi:unnamed protein product [Thlaspi arvense]|uniref:Transposase MuDR plant domain-containing protein n=1 Tax=Thlaspi arvense TaxID=13288 RepID=A0AAU9TBV6_THLAR|nr:unnamed protein product [Thlaspi arvense]
MGFEVDISKRGSMSLVDEDITFKDLIQLVKEDLGMVDVGEITLTYRVSLTTGSVENGVGNHFGYQNFANNIQSNTANKQTQQAIGSNNHSTTTYNQTEPELYRPVESNISVTEANEDTCSTAEKGNYFSDLLPAVNVHPVLLVLSVSNAGSNDLHVNQYSKNKEELMQKMRKYVLDRKFEFRTRYSDKSRAILRCVDEKCSWMMRATKLGDSDFFCGETLY